MKKWLEAIRLRTLPLAASCVLAGSAAAWSSSSAPWLITGLTLLTTFLLQILSNLANDYGDHEKGVDNDQRLGPARTMQQGLISKSQMKKALIICSLMALFSGLWLLWVSLGASGRFIQSLLFLLLGLAAIAAALNYTMGKNPYGYRGFGDLFVFVFFGITGVCGTYYLHTGTMNIPALLPATAVGLFSTAVLNLNNLRDHQNDKASGKRTLVVAMGQKAGRIYHALLIVVGSVTGVWWVMKNTSGFLSFLPLIAIVIHLLLLTRVLKNNDPAKLDPELKKVALSTFLFALLLFINALNK